MADYPNKYPVLPVVAPKVSVPKSSDKVLPMREITALATELGVNPKTISDAIAPTSTPASVAVYLDMIANILKTISGAANWHQANVPLRRIIGGSGALGTIGAAATNYVFMNGRGLTATENLAHMVMPYRGVVKNLYVILSTAQPSTGTLVFTLRKSDPNNNLQAADVGLVLTIAASAAAGTFSTLGSVRYNPGDILSVKAVNNASGASAQINGVTMEYDQYG